MLLSRQSRALASFSRGDKGLPCLCSSHASSAHGKLNPSNIQGGEGADVSVITNLSAPLQLVKAPHPCCRRRSESNSTEISQCLCILGILSCHEDALKESVKWNCCRAFCEPAVMIFSAFVDPTEGRRYFPKPDLRDWKKQTDALRPCHIVRLVCKVWVVTLNTESGSDKHEWYLLIQFHQGRSELPNHAHGLARSFLAGNGHC